jgi:hypothetical protein
VPLENGHLTIANHRRLTTSSEAIPHRYLRIGHDYPARNQLRLIIGAVSRETLYSHRAMALWHSHEAQPLLNL